MTIYFCNDEYFDVRAMLTFGVSAKADDTAIGYFGTGFKYAVAIILRLGGSIEVTSGDDRSVFTVEKALIRGKEFNIVKVNGNEAGFTTRLGINWEPWMAFRELYSNCKDESGTVGEKPTSANTVIRVDCIDIDSAYRDRGRYFIDSTPLYSGAEAEIYEKSRPYIFYKGVAVTPVDGSAIFSYNITSPITLTEDRTVRHDYQVRFALQKTLQNMDRPSMLRKVLTQHDSFESKLGVDADWGASDAFLSISNDLMHSGQGVSESVRKMLLSFDEKRGDFPEVELTRVQAAMMERATGFLQGIGVDITAFPVKTVKSLGEGVMGRALDGVIYLSDIPFNMGTKQVASTLLEEWVHNKYGCQDFDRQMQSWLFDKVLSLGEEMNGSPL